MQNSPRKRVQYPGIRVNNLGRSSLMRDRRLLRLQMTGFKKRGIKSNTTMAERKKGGRPVLGEHKKGKGLYVSFTEAEHELLTRKSGSVGKSKQAYLRELLVKGYVKNIETAEQQEIKRGLIGLSNNVNQLSIRVNVAGCG